MNRTFIIGEIGINHNGCIQNALRLIDVAALAGCDAVKFQKRDPDVCVPEPQKTKMRDTPWGQMTYLEYKKKVEFEYEEYKEINKRCIHHGIEWSASPWDLNSLEFLKSWDVPFLKLPSAMLTNDMLLSYSARWCITYGKKLIISTGMSTEGEVDAAVNLIRFEEEQLKERGSVMPGYQTYILHCNSTYPAPVEELNLSAINTLKKYGYPVGYSGHEFRLGTSVAAVYLGAEVIERHITLDRTMWGTDQLSSVEPQGLIKLVKGVRELEAAYGNGEISVTESEVPVREKLRGA